MVSLTFGKSGTIISLMMRYELDASSNRIISVENINIYLLGITLHGLLMIFFLVMPTLIGLYGNHLVPVFIAASEVLYPRINNVSVLIIPSVSKIMLSSMISEYGTGVGWTLYPPLSTSLMTLTNIGMDIFSYSVSYLGVSSSSTTINYVVSLH